MRTINAQRGFDWGHTARPAVTFSQLTTEARTRGTLGTQPVGYNYDPCNFNRLYKGVFAVFVLSNEVPLLALQYLKMKGGDACRNAFRNRLS
jgi:hypothetical protein